MKRAILFQDVNILSRLCDEIFFRSWWVILFILICFMCYEQGLKKLNADYGKLHAQFKELQDDYQTVKEIQELYSTKLNSFNDPEWIEMVLISELGLIPANQKKIYFSDR